MLHLFLAKIYTAFFFGFCNSILTKQNTLYKSWKCKLQMKINKNERGIWGITIWPHWNVLSFSSSGWECKLKLILRLHYIGHFFGENIFRFVGWSHNNLFDHLKYETLVCKKNCNHDVFFLLTSYFNILTFKS